MAFTPQNPAGQPTWTAGASPSTLFTRLSGTGQVIIVGGYGIGAYGDGPYGEGIGIAIQIDGSTTWSIFTTR